MNQFKGTPGPWKVADYDHCLAVECIVNGIGHTVVTDQFCYPNFKQNKDPEKQANAALIAAAPEMLEMLQEIADEMSLQGTNAAVLHRIQSITTKATTI